jgi:hypothetical protein
MSKSSSKNILEIPNAFVQPKKVYNIVDLATKVKKTNSHHRIK